MACFVTRGQRNFNGIFCRQTRFSSGFVAKGSLHNLCHVHASRCQFSDRLLVSPELHVHTQGMSACLRRGSFPFPFMGPCSGLSALSALSTCVLPETPPVDWRNLFVCSCRTVATSRPHPSVRLLHVSLPIAAWRSHKRPSTPFS